MADKFTIGIDTGGTFTDAYVADAGGRRWTAKVPTTPHDLTVCFADAISECAAAVGVPRDVFLRQTSVIRFSSTIATNTALTLSGPKLGLIVTAGEEGTLYGAAEGGKIFQFILPDMVAGIEEEVSVDGEVAREPDPEQVNQVARDLLERGARILVVSLKNSNANPANELAVMKMINESYPRHYLGAVATLLSTHVGSVASDPKRTAAAVVNAYMHKQLALSLYKAEDELRDGGLRHPLLVVAADGTVARVAKTRALSTYQSGPASGVHAGALLSEGDDVALTADVGGTSTDLGLIVGGKPLERESVDVRGLDLPHSTVELFSLALGGGSICRVADGRVRVGPESAAAAPGPACFGLGGRDPTPTDAWLVLGYLDPNFYLGGRRRLLPDRARAALDDEIGKGLQLSTEEAALETKESAERVVAQGVEEMLRRPGAASTLGGRSPRDMVLIAYGGGGGILLPSVARRVGMKRVALAALSPVFSAFGVSTFDIEHRYVARAHLNGAGIVAVVEKLSSAAMTDIRGEGFDQDAASLRVSVAEEQGTPIMVGVPLEELSDRLGSIKGKEGSSVIVSLAATCEVPKPGLPEFEKGRSDASAAETGTREILLGEGRHTVPTYARDKLLAGVSIDGPCLIESSGSTYLIPEESTCTIDRFGTALINLS